MRDRLELSENQSLEYWMLQLLYHSVCRRLKANRLCDNESVGAGVVDRETITW
jgi:hypothetical protein